MIRNISATARLVVGGIYQQGPMQYYQTWKKAEEIYRKSIPSLPPLMILAEESLQPKVKPPQDLKKEYVVGHHGTSFPLVEDQIAKGRFSHDKGKLYIGLSPQQAAQYAHVRKGSQDSKDAIILEILYRDSALMDEFLLPTSFTLPREGNEVYIVRTWHVNPEFLCALNTVPSPSLRRRKIAEISSKIAGEN